MDFIFEYGWHGDVIVEHSGKKHNFGYLYVNKLPVMLWLSYCQAGRGNLFNDVEVPEFPLAYQRDAGVEEMIQDATALASRLPMPVPVFNTETQLTGFSGFTDGSNSAFYNFSMDETNRLYLRRTFRDSDKEELAMGLDLPDTLFMTQEYLKFLNSEQRLSIYKPQMGRIIAELGREKI